MLREVVKIVESSSKDGDIIKELDKYIDKLIKEKNSKALDVLVKELNKILKEMK